jgi:hypothetical protein
VIPAERFTGTVRRLSPVDEAPLRDWITAIPFSEWPQQAPIDYHLRPAMVNDPNWHAFGAKSNRLVREILRWTTGGIALGRLLSVVMPGHTIPPHVDKVAPGWWGRVHVPLTDAPLSRFLVGGEAHHLEPGWAYLVNITAEHSVENPDPAPRVHFMVDIGAAE